MMLPRWTACKRSAKCDWRELVQGVYAHNMAPPDNSGRTNGSQTGSEKGSETVWELTVDVVV
jgi:hypothetical protein